jgi:hypothetical protein
VTGDHNTVTINVLDHRPQYPAFREKAGMVYFSFGGNTMGLPAESLTKARFEPFNVFGQKPFKMHGKDGVLYVDFRATGPRGSIEVVDNEFTVSSPDWDKNSNDRAFEVVDQSGLPVFQMVRNGIDRITVKGIFPMPGGVLIGDDNGVRVGPKVQVSGATIKPVFKYPAWKHPGKYADGSN